MTYDESIIVFDFDDTLFPTSFLQQFDYDINMIDPSFQKLLFKILSKAIETKSKVYIVTNAQLKWLDYCFENLIPEVSVLKPYLNIVSATEYAMLNRKVSSTLELNNLSKCFMFDKIILDSNMHESKNSQFMSIGDGLPETVAMKFIKGKYPNITTKAIRFVEKPNYRDLCAQLLFLKKVFKKIFKETVDLDLSMKDSSDLSFNAQIETLFQEPEEVEKELLW